MEKHGFLYIFLNYFIKIIMYIHQKKIINSIYNFFILKFKNLEANMEADKKDNWETYPS